VCFGGEGGTTPAMPAVTDAIIDSLAELLLSRRDRPWQQAHHGDQRHRAAAPSRPGLSPLPRPAGLERLAADNRPLGAAVSLRPKPQAIRSASSHSTSVCPVVPPFSLAWGRHRDGIIQLCCPQINQQTSTMTEPLGAETIAAQRLLLPAVRCAERM